MSAVTSSNFATFSPILTKAPASASPTSAPVIQAPSRQDKVELSLAGRIALGQEDGDLTSSQGQQLYSQLKTAVAQPQGGTSGTGQLLGQLSQAIYGDGHDGATIPTDATITPATARATEEAGRVVAQESAGKLTSTQSNTFLAQVGQIYQQSENGASATATTQAQNQLSLEIYNAAYATNIPADA